MVGESLETNKKGLKDRNVDKCLPPRNRYRTWLIRYYFFYKGCGTLIEAAESLKNTREKSGVSLEEVSQDLNIPELFLEQIESGAVGAFEDIYELKNMLLEYAKYLGLNTDEITLKFNEYMFDYTSKIQVDEIEKAMKEKKTKKEDEEIIHSPYTKITEKEKSLPYIISGIVILLLVLLVLIWSIKQITVNSNIVGFLG